MLKINGLSHSLEDYKYIDLFAGIGGFRYALDSFGATCVFSSEWDKNAQEVYKNNFGDMPEGDITQVDEKEIPKHDILCAGFPCQAFSISGNKKGFNDTRGTLFFDIVRIAKYHKPKFLFLENVRNFENHDNGNTLKTVYNVLESLGYNVFHKVLNASCFGVPQNRERIYVLAFRQEKINIQNYEFVKPSMRSVTLKEIFLEKEYIEEFYINREDIILNTSKKIEPDIFGNYPLKPIRIGTVNKGGQGERIYHECGHAITLSAYGGGIGAKTGLYATNGKVRKLAPRECARLMTFPESFIMHSSKYQSYKQFGNSVVVDVLQYILQDLIIKKVLH